LCGRTTFLILSGSSPLVSSPRSFLSLWRSPTHFFCPGMTPNALFFLFLSVGISFSFFCSLSHRFSHTSLHVCPVHYPGGFPSFHTLFFHPHPLPFFISCRLFFFPRTVFSFPPPLLKPFSLPLIWCLSGRVSSAALLVEDTHSFGTPLLLSYPERCPTLFLFFPATKIH